MILKAEASIDLDANRKVWIQLSGKTDEGDDPTEIIPVLADSLVAAAIKSYEEAAVQIGIRPPGTLDLTTFGDD